MDYSNPNELTPVRFYNVNKDNSTRYHGYDAGRNMAGHDVWVLAEDLLRIVTEDVWTLGGDLRDWASMLGSLELPENSIELHSTGERLYRLTDCSFVYEGE